MLTSSESPGDLQRAGRLRLDGYLSKPATARSLEGAFAEERQ